MSKYFKSAGSLRLKIAHRNVQVTDKGLLLGDNIKGKEKNKIDIRVLGTLLILSKI